MSEIDEAYLRERLERIHKTTFYAVVVSRVHRALIVAQDTGQAIDDLNSNYILGGLADTAQFLSGEAHAEAEWLLDSLEKAERLLMYKQSS